MAQAPDAPPRRSGSRRRLGILSTLVGLTLAVIAGFFVTRAVVDEWSTVEPKLGSASVGWLVVGVLTAAVAMVAIAVPWHRCLALVGVATTRRAATAWYFVGEIGKYVPGGIWPVVGRGELARSGGHPRAATYASVGLSLAVLYLAAMAVAAVLVPVRLLRSGADALWVLLLLPVGLGLLHHRPLEWLVRRIERVMHREVPVVVPRWRDTLLLLVRYVPAWLLVGTATWCIARALDPGASWLTIAPAAILSWVVGFLLIPVPGGVGVREAAFVALVGSSMGTGVRSAVAIAARLAFIVVDGGAAAICALLLRRWQAPEPGDAAESPRAPDGSVSPAPGTPRPSTGTGSAPT
ncbi:MAG: lysylphosphatidylglycerol synthase domain-containing protein [Acidimicrobiia bacterium]